MFARLGELIFWGGNAMAGFQISCPKCGKSLKLPDRSLLGRKGRCSKCRHAFVMTAPGLDPRTEEIDEGQLNVSELYSELEQIEQRRADADEVQMEIADPGMRNPPSGTGARWVPDAQPINDTPPSPAPQMIPPGYPYPVPPQQWGVPPGYPQVPYPPQPGMPYPYLVPPGYAPMLYGTPQYMPPPMMAPPPQAAVPPPFVPAAPAPFVPAAPRRWSRLRATVRSKFSKNQSRPPARCRLRSRCCRPTRCGSRRRNPSRRSLGRRNRLSWQRSLRLVSCSWGESWCSLWVVDPERTEKRRAKRLRKIRRRRRTK